LERLREVLQDFGRKYAVGFGVRIEKDEVWLDWFTEVGIELAYVAEGYDRHYSELKSATATNRTFKR